MSRGLQVDHFRQLIVKSLQGRGPFQAAFSPRLSYHLSGWFTRQHRLTDPPRRREAEANLDLHKGRLDRPQRMALQLSGLGEAMKINHLKTTVFSPKCYQLATQQMKYGKEEHD